MKTCFVSMPLIGEYDQVFAVISAEVRDSLHGKWQCTRGDSTCPPGMVVERVVSLLLNADLVIAVVADLRKDSPINPNVMYELGIAHSYRKPTLVITDVQQELPFALRPIEIIPLDFSSPDLLENLRKAIRRALDEDDLLAVLGSKGSPKNPVSTLLKDAQVFVEDLPWLWGYCDVLSRERQASTIWEITRDLYWPKERLFFESIKDAIRQGRKHYFMVEDSEHVRRAMNSIKNELLKDFSKRDISDLMHFVAIDESYFELWPIAVVLYDADLATHQGGIICEPMQSQVGDDAYDKKIQKRFAQLGKSGELGAFQEELEHWSWLERRQEATFDIALDERVVAKLATAFARIWNSKILEEAERESGDSKAALLNTWLIGGARE